ncbi:hypothetical protein NKI39_09015 [Mesorhizobium sp. M0664]|uniref:hypothetical protein n=1 Tax=Mesorhizobium sp. M0664 TaxID=2956982 RepID=UPI003335870F
MTGISRQGKSDRDHFQYSTGEIEEIASAAAAATSRPSRDNVDRYIAPLQYEANCYLGMIRFSLKLPDRKFTAVNRIELRKKAQAVYESMDIGELPPAPDGSFPVHPSEAGSLQRLIGLLLQGQVSESDFLRECARRALRSELERLGVESFEEGSKRSKRDTDYRDNFLHEISLIWAELEGKCLRDCSVSPAPGSPMMNFIAAVAGPVLERAGQSVDRERMVGIIRRLKKAKIQTN